MQVRLGVPISDVYVVTSHCGTMLGRMMAAPTPSPLLVTTPDRIDTITTALAAHTAGVVPLAGIAITDHSGVPSPFRAALRAIFEGLERTHRARAGDGTQYSLPVFITGLDTYHANKVRRVLRAVRAVCVCVCFGSGHLKLDLACCGDGSVSAAAEVVLP